MNDSEPDKQLRQQRPQQINTVRQNSRLSNQDRSRDQGTIQSRSIESVIYPKQNAPRPLARQLQEKIEQLYGGNPKNFQQPMSHEVNISSVSHEIVSVNRLSMSRSNEDLRYGDSNFICIRLRKLEFFCPTDKFIQHSEYFTKIYEDNITEQEAARHKEKSASTQLVQILINLPEETKANVLMFMLSCIVNDEDDFRIHDLTLTMAIDLAEMAHYFKMRQLVREVLRKVIIPQVNRENVVYFVKIAFIKVHQLSSQYRQEEVSDSESDEDFEEGDEEKSERSVSSDSQGDKKRRIVDVCIDKDDMIQELHEEESLWLDFFFYCIDMTAQHLLYISQTQWNDLTNQMPNPVVLEIINKTVQFFKADPHYDSRALIQLAMKAHNCLSVFHLLKKERERVIQEELNYRQEQRRDTLVTWSVANISQCFYKQSDNIMLLDAEWRLALSYFQGQNTGLRVDIKLLNNPYDVKKSKDFFKKREFEVPSNLETEHVNPIAKLQVEYQEEEIDKKRKIDKIDAHASKFPQYNFVSFLASVHFDFDAQPAEPELHTLICSAKAPTELRRVQDFDLDMIEEKEQINVGVFIQMQDLHAMVMSYINQNFSALINDPDIKYLKKEEFKILLKHKYLNVTQEDEVLKAICMWVDGQQSLSSKCNDVNVHDSNKKREMRSKLSNQTTLVNQRLQDQQNQQSLWKLQEAINELLNQVNWDYVSLPCLLDVIKSYPTIRNCSVWRNMVYKQFTERLERKTHTEESDAEEAEDPEDGKHPQSQPRWSYKYNRSQKQLYPTAAELGCQLGKPIFAMPEDVRQFQLLYPVQVYPDFLQHLVDCMVNQVPIIQSQQQQFALIQTDEPPLGKHVHRRQLLEKLKRSQQELQFIQDQLEALEIEELLKQNENKSHSSGGMSGFGLNDRQQQFFARFDKYSSQIQEGKQQLGSRNEQIRMYTSSFDMKEALSKFSSEILQSPKRIRTMGSQKHNNNQVVNIEPPVDLLPEQSKDQIKLSESSSESESAVSGSEEEQKISQIRVRSMQSRSSSSNEISNNQVKRHKKLNKKIGSLDEEQSVQTGKFGKSESGQYSGSFIRPVILKDVEIQVSDSFAELLPIQDSKSDSDSKRKEANSEFNTSLFSFQNKCKNDSGTQTDSVLTTDASNQTDIELQSSRKSQLSPKYNQKLSRALSWQSLKSRRKLKKHVSPILSGLARKLGKSYQVKVKEEDMTKQNKTDLEKNIVQSWNADLHAPSSDFSIFPDHKSSSYESQEEIPNLVNSESRVQTKRSNLLQQVHLSEDSEDSIDDARQALATSKKQSQELSQIMESVVSSKSYTGSSHGAKQQDANALELSLLDANIGAAKQRAYTQFYSNSKQSQMINVKELGSSTIMSSPQYSMIDQMQRLHEFFGLCYFDRRVVELEIIHPKPELQDQSTFMTPPKEQEEESKGSSKLINQEKIDFEIAQRKRSPEDFNADKPAKKVAKGKSLIQRKVDNQRRSSLQHSSHPEIAPALSQQDERLDPNSSRVPERQDSLNDNAASCQALRKDAGMQFKQRQLGPSSAQAKEQSKVIAAGVPKPNGSPPKRAAAAIIGKQKVSSQAREPDQIERLTKSLTGQQKVEMKPQNA